MHVYLPIYRLPFTLYLDIYFISSLLGSSKSYSNTLKLTPFNCLLADAIFPLLCVTKLFHSFIILLYKKSFNSIKLLDFISWFKICIISVFSLMLNQQNLCHSEYTPKTSFSNSSPYYKHIILS